MCTVQGVFTNCFLNYLKHICNWLCLPIVLKCMEFKLDNAYLLIIIAMLHNYVILTLTLNCERETFVSTRQLKYWLPIAVYLAVKN